MPECAIVNDHARAVSVFESSLERIQPVAPNVRAIELAVVLSTGPADLEASLREGHEVDERTKAVNPQYCAAPLPEPRIDVFPPHEFNVRMPPTAPRTPHPEQLKHEFDVIGQRTLPDRGRRDTNVSFAQGAGDECAPLRVFERANPRPSLRQHSAGPGPAARWHQPSARREQGEQGRASHIACVDQRNGRRRLGASTPGRDSLRERHARSCPSGSSEGKRETQSGSGSCSRRFAPDNGARYPRRCTLQTLRCSSRRCRHRAGSGHRRRRLRERSDGEQWPLPLHTGEP